MGGLVSDPQGGPTLLVTSTTRPKTFHLEKSFDETSSAETVPNCTNQSMLSWQSTGISNNTGRHFFQILELEKCIKGFGVYNQCSLHWSAETALLVSVEHVGAR